MAKTTAKDIDVKFTTPDDYLNLELYQNFLILRKLLENGTGVTGTFTTVDGKTITVTNGIVTGIV